ncbi:hypothetical protein QK292_12990 [Arthrobacter sp. AL08]|uniref:sunset domain-containing protein n=1 Tax=unclassified Arthrobacter TaxID=235627 RepID=UPI00249C1DFD|nr:MULTISPECIES: hypothetical protein [unclassified Arthrobacter]MDI3242525.1 hypothetical protein [Arthrobacter sp. AL05]MDI3278479.1 hypothetical protein [Arthrobacter sp. AL08]
MDWIIWLVVIAVIVAIVWWLLGRNSSRGKSGATVNAPASNAPATATPAAASATAAPAAASNEGDAAAGSKAAEPAPASPKPALPDLPAAAAETVPAEQGADWETQWSETPPAEPHSMVHPDAAGGARSEHLAAQASAVAESLPVHHPEYTQPHAPTLPGAESAAAEATESAEPAEATEASVEAAEATEASVEAAEAHTVPAPAAVPPAQSTAGSPAAEASTLTAAADTGISAADTRQSAASSAASETAAGHGAEPAGHLAVDQPYGEGSAAPAPDGSGPEGFTVKGNASSMVYHDETSPSFEETVAEVWFLSPAHAEAAGFRAPRRTRH